MDTHSFGDVAHTADNLNIYFRATRDRWNLEEKVHVMVTDNAANITSGVNISDCESIRCTAHTLQLAVNNVLEEPKLKELVKKGRAIVTHFKQSTKSYEILKKMQERCGIKQLKLIQDV